MTLLRGLLVDLVPTAPDWDQKMAEFWNNDSRQWATMGDNEPVSRATLARLRERRQDGRARGHSGVQFVLRARDGQTIGHIGLNWVNACHRVGSLGAWIGEPAYWSGGHGSDALLLMTDYAFDWLDLRRLALETMSINERARQNVIKCGFTTEACRRRAALVNGQWVDEIAYGLLREEWPGRAVMVERLGLREQAVKRYGTLVEG